MNKTIFPFLTVLALSLSAPSIHANTLFVVDNNFHTSMGNTRLPASFSVKTLGPQGMTKCPVAGQETVRLNEYSNYGFCTDAPCFWPLTSEQLSGTPCADQTEFYFEIIADNGGLYMAHRTVGPFTAKGQRCTIKTQVGKPNIQCY